MLKSYKRVLALLLSVLMLFTAIPTSAFAVTQDDEVIYEPVEFSITSVKGVANKTVHVEVRVTENSQIASLGLELLFDSSKLLVTDYSAGELMANGLSAINANVSDKIIVSFATMEPITEAGTLFSVDFNVSTEEINDIIDMEINVTEATDINSDELIATTESGTVEVVDLLYGDVTFDNRITSVDALKILASMTQETVLTEEELKAGDVNGDGEVSVSDALQILYFSAEIITDFQIYNLESPQNLTVTDLDGYQFTVEWDYQKDVLGYNVYLDGTLVNDELLTENSVSIGVNMDGEYGCSHIPNRIHDKIEQISNYNVEITAVNSLKESDTSAITVTTKRIWSWVTFVDWDGTLIKKARVYYGEDAIVPNNPTREDYFFTGWDKDTTNIKDDTVITATYEDAHYDFVFLNEDGTELYRQDVTVNGKATPPSNPIKTGYTFSGWYTAANGGEKVEDFTITSATKERTVYAQYTINTYTVYFDSNGGTAVNNSSAVYQTNVTKPTAPTRLGYGFVGWYKDNACTNAWDFSKDVISSYDLTLYAKWKPVEITIDKANVTLNAQGSTAQLKATITGGTDTITWSSSNTSVATVSSSGLITAVGHGTATIYIKGVSSERRPVCKVTVNVAKDAWVTADSLRIRSGPSTNHSVVGWLNTGDKIVVYGDKQAHGTSGQSAWYYIKFGNVYGYISADYVSFTETPAVIVPTGNFAQRISQLRTKFPHGKYWNHKTTSSHNHNGYASSCTAPGCNNPDGVTDHPCTSHSGVVSGAGKYDCNNTNVGGTGGALQCAGFAQKVYSDVHGQSIGSGQKIWNPSFDQLRPGDYVRIDGDSHSIFVLEKGSNYIKTVECNFYGAPCQIRWDITRYKGNFTINYICRPW